jgi:hypothetical protein
MRYSSSAKAMCKSSNSLPKKLWNAAWKTRLGESFVLLPNKSKSRSCRLEPSSDTRTSSWNAYDVTRHKWFQQRQQYTQQTNISFGNTWTIYHFVGNKSCVLFGVSRTKSNRTIKQSSR